MDVRVSRFDKFDVCGRDPVVKLNQRPILGSISATCEFGNELYKVPFDVLPDYLTISLPGKYKKGSRISVRGEYSVSFLDTPPPKLSSREWWGDAYKSIIVKQFDEFCSSSAEQDISSRCPYCNCKLDSTKTHCTSCGAPC